jgi:hypothetical protein
MRTESRGLLETEALSSGYESGLEQRLADVSHCTPATTSPGAMLDACHQYRVAQTALTSTLTRLAPWEFRLANHTGPESCAGLGNKVSEALTGERAGRVLSPEIKAHPGRRRAPNTRKAILAAPRGRGAGRPGGVEDPWHARRHLVRDPGDAAIGLGLPKVRTENPQGARP